MEMSLMHIKHAAEHLWFFKESPEGVQAQPHAVGSISNDLAGQNPSLEEGGSLGTTLPSHPGWEGLTRSERGVLTGGWMALGFMAREQQGKGCGKGGISHATIT